MNISNCFIKHAGLNINIYFVLMLLCTQIFAVILTSENVILKKEQLESINQFHSEADSQIPISTKKCCERNEFLARVDENNECVELPENIKNISLESSRNRQFSTSGILDGKFCTTSRTIEMWTKANAQDYRYYLKNETVLNLATKTYFKVLCSDYINLHESYSEDVNYDDENFKKLEAEATGVILCNIWKKTLEEKIASFLSTYGNGFSNFFLAVTFYLYITTSKLRRNIQGKCILCYVAALIFGFSSYIGSVLLGENNNSSVYCSLTEMLEMICGIKLFNWSLQMLYRLIVGIFLLTRRWTFCATYRVFYRILCPFLSQYWLLSMFTWLTLICINLSRSIASPTPHYSETRKFMVYCALGWGLPLVMSLATYQASRLDTEHFLKVDFEEGCWFLPEKGKSYWLQPEFIYFNSYVSLTLLINACLFIRTTFTLISNDCYWKKLEDGQRHKANENRFPMYLRLFLVMGSTWVMGSISFNMNFTNEVSHWVHIVLNLLTMSQGILIFIVFVCISRNEELKKRFNTSQKQHSRISTQLTL